MTCSDLGALGTAGAALAQSLEDGRLAHAWLFEGADAETLGRAARAFAAEVLARSVSKSQAPRARRLALAGTHPDLHLLARDKATVISVEALVPLLAEAHQTPVEGTHQVFVIDPADALEPEGVARYLKTLEEPPEGTIFVLVTTHAESLPDTVLSRCRRVRFPPLGVAELAAGLETSGVARPRAVQLARWASGSLERARRLEAAGVPELAARLAAASMPAPPTAARVSTEVLSALERAAAELASADEAAGVDRKREHLRTLLKDVLHVLAVEARDRAAAREAPLLPDLPVEASLDLLERLAGLDTAVGRNVTPAAIVLEAIAVLRRARPDAPVRDTFA